MIDYNATPQELFYPRPLKATHKIADELWRDGTMFVHPCPENSMRHFVFKGSGSARVFGTSAVDRSLHVPHLVRAFSKLPRGTILVVDLVHESIASLMRSKPQNAIARQGETLPVEAVVLDALHVKGTDLTDAPFAHRMSFIQKWVKRRFRGKGKIVHAPVNLASHFTFDMLFEDDSEISNNGYYLWNLHEPYSYYKWGRNKATASST